MEEEKQAMVVPFSNGTQAMDWMHNNCYSCKHACLWDESTDYRFFEEAVKDGRECWMKHDLDIGFITGEIPKKTYEAIKGNQEYMYRCNKWKPRDDNQGDEGINPKPENPFQLKLFPLEHAKEIVKENIEVKSN